MSIGRRPLFLGPLCAFVAACGGGSGSEPDPPTPPSPSPPAPPADAPPPPEIVDERFGALAVKAWFDARLAPDIVLGADGAVFGINERDLFVIDRTGRYRVRATFHWGASGEGLYGPRHLRSGPGDVHLFLVTEGGPSSDTYGGLLLGIDADDAVTTWSVAGYNHSYDGFDVDAQARVWLASAGSEDGSEGAAGFVRLVSEIGVRAAAWRLDDPLVHPTAPIVAGPDGHAFGLCVESESAFSSLGDRPDTVFRIDAAGASFRVARFDGTGPLGDLLQPVLALDADGWLVGASASGGPEGNGALWRMRSDGTQAQVLRGCAAGEKFGGLRAARDGRVYGSSTADGGTLFRVEADGGLSVLHAFDPGLSPPLSAPIVAADGSLWGTISGGGPSRAAIYRLDPPG